MILIIFPYSMSISFNNIDFQA